MKARMARLFLNLGRVSGDTLIQLLVHHLRVDLEGVHLAQSLLADGASAEAALESMNEIEHQGDVLRRELARDLSKSLVTTIDREDLFRLSRSIDDVLDNIRDFVREWTIYRPTSSESLPGMLDAIALAIASLEIAVSAIGGPRDGVVPAGIDAKKACNQVRREYQKQLGELFDREISIDVLKLRELLRRLDVVGLRLDEAVDVLLDATVKRGG